MDNEANVYMKETVGNSCFLVDDDKQCGLMFFNVKSLELKFFCAFCADAYDNVVLFSEHLKLHIHEDVNTELNKDDSKNISFGVEDTTELVGFAADLALQSPDRIAEQEHEYYNTEWAIEKLDEAAEIEAEVEEEMLLADEHYRQEESDTYDDYLDYTADDTVPLVDEVEEKSGPRNIMESQARHSETSTQTIEHMGTEDFEQIFDADENEIITIPQNTWKRRKKITTVKVIPAKNEIEELYKKINLEVQRLSKISKEGESVNERSKSVEKIIIDEDIQEYEKSEQACKVIGETLITLLTKSSPLPTTNPPSNYACNAGNKLSYYNNQKPSKCIACGKVFRSPFSLTIHKRTHYLESNNDIKLAHKCSHCDLLFNRVVQLKDHIQKVHYPEGFICKICNKKLSSLTLLETHMRKVHLNRPFSCNVCKKSFDDNYSLRLHSDTHIPQVAGQCFKCHMCGRKFSTNELLKQHAQRHKERVPQCCVVCGKMTLRITQHMKMHAPRPKRVIQCKICSKVFNYSSGLSHHFRVMHRHPRPSPKTTKKNASVKETEQVSITTLEHHQKQQQNSCNYNSGEDITQKEEEAKRVIVELIQNAGYTSLLTEDFEAAPPIAREETITAVNNIVSDFEE